ncbi:MAG: hypothetical protein U9N73_03135 [Candidatus Auribacterota bacterium]|nr:hypothetical protein [Candidatus Auribacterota bacterium]
MDDQSIMGLGYKFLKILLIILIIGGVIFLVKIIIDRVPPDLEKHRAQLDLLDRVYNIRQEKLEVIAEEKVKNAPNEVLAIKYQQDLNLDLSAAEQLYFADREAIINSNYQVLEVHWKPELEEAKSSPGEDDKISP